jgi:hypothetical protein
LPAVKWPFVNVWLILQLKDERTTVK